MATFDQQLARLKADLVTQGNRVEDLVLRAVESYFEHDEIGAAAAIHDDEVIDRVDVEIERASIPILAMGETDEHKIRSVLMIVKINNELERVADCAVNIAEVVMNTEGDGQHTAPSTFRVMANSVIGMLREANRALATSDIELAQRVLTYDDTVDQFKREISIDAERKVAAGQFTVSFAFRLRTVAARLERIADHCTNICEQIIYLETGKVVRHLPAGWTVPAAPEL